MNRCGAFDRKMVWMCACLNFIQHSHVNHSMKSKCAYNDLLIWYHEILGHTSDVDFEMLEIFFSFQCTKYEENRWLITNLSKKRDAKRKYVFSALFWHTVHTWIVHFGWVRWDPKWPWVPCQWLGITFQAFGGPSGAQIAFTMLLATSICNKKPYSDTVYNLRQGALVANTEMVVQNW